MGPKNPSIMHDSERPATVAWALHGVHFVRNDITKKQSHLWQQLGKGQPQKQKSLIPWQLQPNEGGHPFRKGPQMRIIWTADMIEQLHRLSQLSLATSEIAAILGCPGRAVSGKLIRLGITRPGLSYGQRARLARRGNALPHGAGMARYRPFWFTCRVAGLAFLKWHCSFSFLVKFQACRRAFSLFLSSCYA